MFVALHPQVRNDLLTHIKIEEVKGVVQVLDQEEEIAISEFAKFEDKLKQQKAQVLGSTADKEGLDSVPG
jgi:NFU1 iron-sulfur cluster scaffold homolog, mitochondrial